MARLAEAARALREHTAFAAVCSWIDYFEGTV